MLERQFEETLRSRPFAGAARLDDDGLILGAGTVLAHMARDSFGTPMLALEEDADRLLALLTAAHMRPAPPTFLTQLEKVSDDWRRGERALANVRLALSSLPRIEDRASAYRLFLAEELLDRGLAPGELRRALGLGEPIPRLVKYDPEQPRVPSGSGRTSGRWTSVGSTATAAEPAKSSAAFRS